MATVTGGTAVAMTRNFLQAAATKYGLTRLQGELDKGDGSLLLKTDLWICLSGIIEQAFFAGKSPAALYEAKNMYKGGIFGPADAAAPVVKALPDLDAAVSALQQFDYCFKLNAYQQVNTLLAIVVAQITGNNLQECVAKGKAHLEGMIADALKNNPVWNEKTLKTKSPRLVVPIGAAGCGKSTFYRELPNVVNISCDNVRYLLFSSFGPCFQPWESTLAWWTVNALTDHYLRAGYHVFYNGVNTDLEYRSPITMENPDSLYAGNTYDIRLVYFEPPVTLTDDERKELAGINLWATKLEAVDFAALSPNVRKIMELIRTNFERTMARTAEIRAGQRQQDPYDILYSVPAAIVKLFVEQSFNKPSTGQVTVVPRREIPDAKEREAFYRERAAQVLA